MEQPLPAQTNAAIDRLRATTQDNMFVFGRYQNLTSLYAPIREWMNSPQWNTFTEIFCSRNYPDWYDLSDDGKRERANSSPYRVMMLDVEIDPINSTFTYTYVRTAATEALFDIGILRTCEIDPDTGCAVRLPPHIHQALLDNAFTNLAFATNSNRRRIMIDLYPDRPPGAVHRFHTDSGTEHARHPASENLEYVSLLFLPPENAVTRGTVLSTNSIRETASFLCRAGTTIMFRDQSFLRADGTAIPSVIHATPDPLPTGNLFYQDPDTNIDFNFRTPTVQRPNHDFNPELPRLFVRVHTSLVPIIRVEHVRDGDTVPIPRTFEQINPQSFVVNDDADIIGALQALDQAGYTAGKRTKSKTISKTRKFKGKNIKDIYFCCTKENYSSFCKSLTGSSISFAFK